jgi:hypothetical protein
MNSRMLYTLRGPQSSAYKEFSMLQYCYVVRLKLVDFSEERVDCMSVLIPWL